MVQETITQLNSTEALNPQEVEVRFEEIVSDIQPTPESLEASTQVGRKEFGRNDPQREFGAK